MSKNIAFTLAETLLVVGIIGIIATLTLPNLNHSTNDIEQVARVKKIYSNLNDAYGHAVAKYGSPSSWAINDDSESAQTTRYGSRMAEFLKVSKNCGTGTGCFTSGNITKSLSGSTKGKDYNSNTSYYKILLADGASVSFYIGDLNAKCIADSEFTADSLSPAYYPCIEIGVDIDGPKKGPYAQGRDYFSFIMTKDGGIYPRGWNGSKAGVDTSTSSNLYTKCFKEGTSCAGWVIENGNMDYLKQTSFGTGKCPNGTVLSWSNTSCK